MRPDFALRFALAYLYGVSSGDCRRAYTDFWQTIQGIGIPATETSRDYVRGTYSCTYLQAICRSVGVEYTVTLKTAMDEARRVRRGRQAGQN